MNLSRHARERAAEMGLRTKDIRRIIRDATTSWSSEHGRRVYALGEHAVVVGADGYIVTVLYHTQERYERP